MDETRFDGWTRRRFGLAAGGMTAAVLGLAGMAGADANKKHKNKHKKKRCKKLGDVCKLDGKRQCCHDLRCAQRLEKVEDPPYSCCKTEGKTCQGELDCCPGLGCEEGHCTRLPKA